MALPELSEGEHISEMDGIIKDQQVQPTRPSSSTKNTPDRDTGSATPVSCVSSSAYTGGQINQQPRLSLTLRGPNLPGITDVEIELNASNSSSNSSYAFGDRTIFQSVQSLIQKSSMGNKVLCKVYVYWVRK